MPLIRVDTGTLDERGRPYFNVVVTDDNGVRIDDPSLTDAERADLSRFRPVVHARHASGDVKLTDGTSYNLDPEFVEAQTLAHAHEISHHMGILHEKYGHPTALPRTDADFHPLRDEFVHICTPECGPAFRTADEHIASLNERVAKTHSHLVGSDETPPDDKWGPIRSHAEVEQAIRDAHAALNTEAEVV